MKLLSERLKELRGDRGLSQPQVADSLDISRSTYANWEQGRREPDVNSLISLANFFDVTVGYLVGTEN